MNGVMIDHANTGSVLLRALANMNCVMIDLANTGSEVGAQ